MIDLVGPHLDFVSLSEGMGVPATRAGTVEELAAQFKTATSTPGTHLIEAVLTGSQYPSAPDRAAENSPEQIWVS
ncbi:hypothetical protein Kisp01_42150 [Kineosporia sp. NBRC 101677]|nr:hypothetical protein [Kineosporia sp. NBRC 101677]GLY17200.1 hypothetical protein Kisp01_42150 [Kineosporia sp. NBRC 101677]